ncbi:uncharacterized protein C8R40DRAFT_1074300 [Lentinula edodes]|uniref:uncharacterized protein n=1 Tax=Lentinula edodes TaxID=5353 RepID=UPI001E8CD65E|nr:uncharacterized protein C8R40DRAFT_1074300 [Lentinula edodes]KAH7869104.1 hypothetical protein C8R40DRAFT_1074300 [Lentinula edodes]
MALEDLEEALEDPADLKAITALTVDLVAVIIMVDSGVQEGLAEDLKVVLEAVPEVGGFQETKTADSLEDLEDITTIMVRVVSVAVILVLEALEEDPVVQLVNKLEGGGNYQHHNGVSGLIPHVPNLFGNNHSHHQPPPGYGGPGPNRDMAFGQGPPQQGRSGFMSPPPPQFGGGGGFMPQGPSQGPGGPGGPGGPQTDGPPRW